jgi:hypothetical protein
VSIRKKITARTSNFGKTGLSCSPLPKRCLTIRRSKTRRSLISLAWFIRTAEIFISLSHKRQHQEAVFRITHTKMDSCSLKPRTRNHLTHTKSKRFWVTF